MGSSSSTQNKAKPNESQSKTKAVANGNTTHVQQQSSGPTQNGPNNLSSDPKPSGQEPSGPLAFGRDQVSFGAGDPANGGQNGHPGYRQKSAAGTRTRVKAMGMEMKREKTMGLKREKTRVNIVTNKREKTSGLHRENTIFDKSRRRLTQSVVGRDALLPKDAFKVDPVFLGSVSVECPSTAKIVRIFTSSTFTDTKFERNRWMEEAYPRIKRFCLERGFDFQVVDMRWGVRDEANDEHTATELCLKELKLCQKLSTGPNFVSLLSHKYGYRSLQRVIDAEEFETLLTAIEDDQAKKLLKKWFRRDDNNVPPVYVLSPISKLIPDFLSVDKDKKKAAKQQWWDESDVIQEALEEAAQKVLGDEKARNYVISVTEREVQMGLLDTKNPKVECLWVKRKIENIEKLEPDWQLSRYIECLGEEEKWQKPRKLLEELRETRMTKVLPPENVLNYAVPWHEKGINPDFPVHKSYLDKMTEDFINLMCRKIDSAIKDHSQSHKTDPLYEECIEHILFCQAKCENFYGREDTLEKVKQYVLGSSNDVLVVHGMSGSGKTSIIAMAANLIPGWLNRGTAVILRFIGTTPNSSNVASMMDSLTKQIKLVYARDTKVPEELPELVQEFERSLEYADDKHPMVILLDSLDQLDTTHNARQLQWLPHRLPPNVKVIVSTLEEEQYQCFQRLQTFVSPDMMIAVPKLPANDVAGIVNHWLANQSRCLTDGQMNILLSSFDNCPLPLFLKLSFDEACRWQSYADKSVTVLQKTIRQSINSLFQRLEVSHGEKFVSRALGYLSAARNGLSEPELEDILSCDEDVLNDVYMYWTPPLRRLPPLLLVRLRTDLQQYLVEREADSVRVTQWYHRQFIEAARDRYCKKDDAPFLHSQLADFFSGKWAGGVKKPYTDKSGKSDNSDRHCVSQPLQYGTDTYNIRKMNNLPYHRLYAGDLQKLKDECLCNFDFLQTKLAAISIREMVDDFDHARRVFPKDAQLNLIGDAIQLSEDDMIYDPFMFPGQMLDRMAGEKNVVEFLKQCEKCSHPHLRPNQEVLVKPGGQLLFAMAGHRGPVRSLDLKQNGKVAVTCCEDGDDEIRTWDVQNGRLIRCYEELGTDPHFVSFINNDELILIQFAGAIKAMNESGDIVYSIETPSPMYQLCVAGANKTIVGIFIENTVTVYDATNGKKLYSVSCGSNSVTFGAEGITAGSKNYMAVSDTTQQNLAIFGLKEKSFLVAKQVMFTDPSGEFMSIDALVISANEKHVYFTDSWTNDIHTCDITKLKEIAVKKGSSDDYSLNFHVSPDGKKLYYSSHKDFVVMDVDSGKKTYMISHPCNITDVRTSDLKRVVTITEDTCVRVWDVTKPVKEGDIQKFFIGYNIWNMKTLPNNRYVAVLFKRTDKDVPDFAFGVYDLAKTKMVRQANLDESPSILEILDDTYAVINMGSRRLKVINMETMAVHSTFEGKLHLQEDTAYVVKDNTGILVRSRNKHNLKLYDIESGKTKTILKGESTMCQISKVACSKSGDYVVAKVIEGPIIVYDISTNTKTVINAKNLGALEVGDKMCVSSRDHRVVVSGEKMVVHSGEKNKEQVAFIWDAKKRCVVKELVDQQYFFRYMTKENRKGLSISVDDVMCVNDTDIVSSHDDYILRVWDLTSGELQHRLMGHSSNIEMFSVEEGVFFVTYGCWEEENALRLWDPTTYTCVASFKLDHPIATAKMCSDGLSFVTNTVNPARIIHWKLHGVEPMIDLSLEKELFPGEKTVDLDLQAVADYEEDASDIDTDFDDTQIDEEDDMDDDDDDDDLDDT